jgi:hypothetical protein
MKGYLLVAIILLGIPVFIIGRVLFEMLFYIAEHDGWVTALTPLLLVVLSIGGGWCLFRYFDNRPAP